MNGPTLEEVHQARRVLADHLPPTRLVPADGLTRRLGVPSYLKLEHELPTGSFKPRGALHALSTRLRAGRVEGVVASSTGNHGAAVAFAARTLGISATVFLPRDPNPVKRDRIRELGAEVVERGPDLASAFLAAREHAARTGAVLLNDATDPLVPAGAGTIALEVLESLPGTRTMVVPMGDTALIRGVGAVARRHPGEIRVVGVQAAGAPAYYLSWKEGRAVPTERCDTIADGLATRTPEVANVEAIRSLVDEVVLVSDRELLLAMRRLLLEEHVVAEPSGAAAAAAGLAMGRVEGPAVFLMTGGNLSPELLGRMASMDAPPLDNPDPDG